VIAPSSVVCFANVWVAQSLEWRRQIGADTILTDFKEPEVIRKYYPGSLFGVAKDGSPVWIEPMGRGDLKGRDFFQMDS
jgi:hypothetical protein